MKSQGPTYQFFTKTIANGALAKVHTFGRYIALLTSTSDSHVNIRIGTSSFQPMPVGLAIEINPHDASFTILSIQNTTGSSVTITFAITAGRIFDNRILFDKSLRVLDIADGMTMYDFGAGTPFAHTIVPQLFNNAAVTNVGGFASFPYTNGTIEDGSIITISGTVAYNGDHEVFSVTATRIQTLTAYAAETMDGVDDKFVLKTPKVIAANPNRRFIDIHNHDATYDLMIGDANLDPANHKGIPIKPGNTYTLEYNGEISLACLAAAEPLGVWYSYIEYTQSYV